MEAKRKLTTEGTYKEYTNKAVKSQRIVSGDRPIPYIISFRCEGEKHLIHRNWPAPLIYYPPEVSSMKYCCLGVFMKEYFRLVIK